MAHVAPNLWPLLGVLAIVCGFALRIHPMLVIVVSAVVTAAAAHLTPLEFFAALGNGFVATRNLSLLLILPLAVIGILERHGLRERAQSWIAGIGAATVGRILLAYLFVRQVSASVGLTSLGGQAQMVRPLLAPMVEGSARAQLRTLDDETREKLLAHCAAADNVGLFFGEDIFVAFGAIALMHTFLKGAGFSVAPLRIAMWGLPTAGCAFAIHAFRIWLLNRRLDRAYGRRA